MKMIDKLHKATDAVIEAINWPGRKRMIARGAESFADDVEALTLKTNMELTEKRKALTAVKSDDEAKRVWREIADLRLKLDDATLLAKTIADEKAFLESEAPADDDDGEV